MREFGPRRQSWITYKDPYHAVHNRSGHDLASVDKVPRDSFWIGTGGVYGPLNAVEAIGLSMQAPLGKPTIEIRSVASSPFSQWICSPIQRGTRRLSACNCPRSRCAGGFRPPPSGVGALDVEVRYLSAWDHKFFGFSDGIVQGFSVGKAPLNAGGRFQIQIPDFSKDPVTNRMQDAYLEVLVVEHSSWNLVEHVLPAANLQYQNTGLKILRGYDPEIVFGRRR